MRLRDSTIVIVGLGLMGGSLSLALRGKCACLLGVARRADVAQLAVSRQVVDVAHCDMPAAVREADIVVLATPVRHILSSIPQVAARMRPDALLMDLGSTKGQIAQAMNSLPPGITAIGGHPMCGKEFGGIEYTDASIYRGATFVLTPTIHTTGESMSLAHELVEAAGAHPLVLDAERHDRAVALISHLPYLLATSLVHAEEEASGQDAVVHTLAASGFRDTSRLAASQVEMMLDVLLTNREAVQQALDRFEQKLAEVRDLLDDATGLKGWMSEAQCRRRGMFQ